MKREGATILLVTHQVELLPEADTLVVMSEGAAVYVGAPTKNTIAAVQQTRIIPENPQR